MVEFKFKKETEKELPHVDIFFNKKYIGYYIKANRYETEKGRKWNFCPDDFDVLDACYTATETEMRQIVEKQLKKEHAILHQSGYRTTEINKKTRSETK